MSEHKPLLIELGTEELPVKALPELARAFADGIVAGLAKRGLAHGAVRTLYTPRRLAVSIEAVATEQPEQKAELLGPYLNIALDADGQPTRALQGFAQKNGVDWAQLERTTDAKGERFVYRAIKPGAATATLLPEIVNDAIRALPIPKPMRWGDHDYAFARPVHWLVLLLGKDVVPAEILGVRADRMSRGHRFHHPKPVWIGAPGDYVDALRAAKVLADPDERRARVRAEVEAAAQAAGGTPSIPEGLLEEVNCLVEWPKAVLCSFEPEFLRVPPEALIATMEDNQKFFPVLDAHGRLTEKFVGVANIESGDEAEVRKGYERVIRPRFADAQFFFDEDLKQGLAAINAGLVNVTYQAKLGSYADKVARVTALAEAIAQEVGVEPAHARRAAELSKADLQSRLVNEFPELQGIAGRYYAAAAGERADVADAIDQGYQPRFAGDAIAPSRLGQVLAVAERLDTLAGGFAAGLKPSGNKDPFALRRNALGLARTLIEGGLELNLRNLLDQAMDQVSFAKTLAQLDKENKAADAARKAGVDVTGVRPVIGGSSVAELEELYDFILDRLRGYYADQGVPAAHFEAVAAVMRPVAAEAAPTGGSDRRDTAVGAASAATAASHSLPDFDRRLKAIGEFAKLPEAEALAAANKRIRNILRKAEDAIPDVIDHALLKESVEMVLAKALDSAERDTEGALAQRDYVAVLSRLAQLRPVVDTFFDDVMVMVEDAGLRRNRLALLKRLADRFATVAAVEQLSVA